MVPIVRSYVAFPAGLARLAPVPFAIACLLGGLAWNTILAFAGYRLGQEYERVGAFLGPLRIPIAAAVVVVLVAGYYLGRRLRTEEA